MRTRSDRIRPAGLENHDDALSVARGVVHGLIAGLLMWALLVALWFI
jgi:hypothetical protein